MKLNVDVLVTHETPDALAATGRFNLAQGAVGTITGIAAAMSTTVMGFIASQSGDAAGFLVMATATGAAIVLAWAFLPETKPAEYLD